MMLSIFVKKILQPNTGNWMSVMKLNQMLSEFRALSPRRDDPKNASKCRKSDENLGNYYSFIFNLTCDYYCLSTGQFWSVPSRGHIYTYTKIWNHNFESRFYHIKVRNRLSLRSCAHPASCFQLVTRIFVFAPRGQYTSPAGNTRQDVFIRVET